MQRNLSITIEFMMNHDDDVSVTKSEEELNQSTHLRNEEMVVKDTSQESNIINVALPNEDELELARLTEEIKVVKRRLLEVNEEIEEPKKGTFSYYLIESVYAFILVVTIATWTILGFIVWQPLLLRTTTLLAGTVFYASLFRDQPRVIHAQKSVNFAVRFYVRGFKHFLNFYQQRHDPEPPIGLFEPLSTMKWKELLIECVWVLGFWIVSYLLMHGVFA